MSPGWFRLVLALTVVVYHASRVVFFGFWAVFVFFVLSGFWISEMYRSRYSKARSPFAVFYVSRLLRIYPVFIACTILSLGVAYSGLDTVMGPRRHDTTWWICTWILPGYCALTHRLLVPAWSLDIELQFYLLFPLIFSACVGSIASRISSSIAVLSISLLLTMMFGLTNSISAYLPFFLAGVAVSQGHWTASRSFTLASTGALVALLGFVALFPESRDSLLSSGNVLVAGHDVTMLVDVVMAILTIPFVSRNVRIADSPLGRHAGNLSFEVYLVHWVILGIYIAHWGHLPMRARFPYFLVYLLMTMATSIAVYVLVDIPSERFRKRLVGKLSM